MFSCNISSGQPSRQEVIRSLRSQIAKAKDDSGKVDLLSELSGALEASHSFDTLLATINTGYALAIKLNYKFGVLRFLQLYAIYYIASAKDYRKATGYLKTAVGIIDSNHLDFDPRIQLLLHFYILSHFFLIGDFTYAMQMVTKRLALFEHAKDTFMIAHYTSLTGFIFLRQRRISDSKKYYRKYLQQAREMNDSVLLADACNCMADVYVEEKDYDSALYNRFSALKIYQTMQLSRPHRLQGVSKSERMTYTLSKIGNTYLLMHKYNQALAYTIPSIDYTRLHAYNPYDLASAYLTAGAIYTSLKDYNKALKYLDSALRLSKDISHSEDLRDAYKNLADVYALQKRYDRAYTSYLMYDKLKDSLQNEKNNYIIEQIHTEYDVDKKDNEILLLNQKNKLHEATVARLALVRNIIIGLAIAIATVIALLYNRRQLQQKNKFQTELNRQRNELFNTVITIQEKERKRIAQDLHDGLGSVLSAAKLKLSELEDDSLMAGPQKEKYFTTLALLDEAANELRNIAHNIMPATLAKIGLAAALQSIFENISSYSGLQIRFTAYGMDKRLNEETEVSIYRIILELVNNVVKTRKGSRSNRSVSKTSCLYKHNS